MHAVQSSLRKSCDSSALPLSGDVPGASAIKETVKKILLDVPLGKPDPKVCLTNPRCDQRPRIVQLGQKGDTCGYYALNMLRPRYRQIGCDTRFPQERDFEQLCSKRRKVRTELDEECVEAREIIKGFSPTQEGASKWMASNKHFLTHPKAKQDGIEKVFAFLEAFCKQKAIGDLNQFLDQRHTQKRLETDLAFLKARDMDPEREYEKMKAFFPKAWKSNSEKEKMLFCNQVAFRATYQGLGFKESPWHPSQPIGKLIETLQAVGPQIAFGYFGKICYVQPPKPWKVVEGHSVLGWTKQNNQQKPGRRLHVVTLIGASEEDGGVVYFVDPADESSPEKARPIYVMSYNRLIMEIADMCQIKPIANDGSPARNTDGSLKLTSNPYAVYHPHFQRLLC
ncbi:MAG: hypothetical protein LLG04_13325 [Parachlamydia sp.]|nr:hypothetical protein [Parachlamydia sp.]